MNKIIIIMKADFPRVLKSFCREFLLMAGLYIFYLLMHCHISASTAILYFQMLFIYELSMKDVVDNVPVYVGMSCTRKSICIAIWLRWAVLFSVFGGLSIAGRVFDSGKINAVFLYQRIAVFILMLGISVLMCIISYYNKWFGLVVGSIMGMIVGISFYFVIDNMGVRIYQYFENIETGMYAVMLIISALVLLIAGIVQKRQIYRFSVI